MTTDRDDRLAAWLAGADDSELAAAVLADDDLAEAAYAALATEAALTAAKGSGLERVSGPRARRWWPGPAWTAGLAAAVLALIVIGLPGDRSGSDLRLRGDGGVGPVGIAPAGVLESFPDRFSWHPVSGFTRYRLEIYDAAARRRFTAVVADTVHQRERGTTPADSIGVWRWLVVPLAADGREGTTSHAMSFTVQPPESE